jgi:hypothetical protein
MSSGGKAFRSEICRRFMFYMGSASMSVGQVFEATLNDIEHLQNTYSTNMTSNGEGIGFTALREKRLAEMQKPLRGRNVRG